MCWNKALTFGVGSKTQTSCHCAHAVYACKDVFNKNVNIIHFSQIVPRVRIRDVLTNTWKLLGLVHNTVDTIPYVRYSIYDNTTLTLASRAKRQRRALTA